MTDTMFKNLQILKQKYHAIGFLIIGVFGSRARGDENENSDIDILYDVNDNFLQTYVGWSAILQMETIKKEIQKALSISHVDLASIDNNSKTFQKNIKSEILYV